MAEKKGKKHPKTSTFIVVLSTEILRADVVLICKRGVGGFSLGLGGDGGQNLCIDTAERGFFCC